MKLIYIVIDSRIDDGVNFGYEIDSVWSSKRKAQKRCNLLNKELTDDPEFGIGLYQVEQKFIQK
jgi:hypothetical protein